MTRTIFAAGCRAWILLRIVAPSFVMMTSPLDVWIYAEMSDSDDSVEETSIPSYPYP